MFKTRGTIVWLIAAVLAAGVGYWYGASTPSEVIQPFRFDHNKHLTAKRASGPITCRTCHKFYATRRASGRPGVKICASCHAATAPKSPAMAKLRRFIDQNREIPWRRVYRVPAHVNYSHRTHVAGAGLKCALCHGLVAKRAVSLTRPLEPISMEKCISCHRAKQVTTDCSACHR